MDYKTSYRHCPLMDAAIDDGACFDIHMVVEDSAPDWTVPEKAIKQENFKEICLECEHHHTD